MGKGESETGYGKEVVDLGKSLSTIELHNETEIETKKIEEICSILGNKKHITLIKKNQDDKVSRYLIDNSGKTAYLERIYLNRIWYRNFDFWKFSLPFLIGFLGVLNSVLQWLIVN